MAAATATTWMFAALLAAAGVRKLRDPRATGAALQGARLPSDARLVRVLGVGEVALGGVVLLVGGAGFASALAVTYAAFAAFAAVQSRRGAGCGCFGDATAPATNLHVAVDAAGAVAAAVAAGAGAPAVLAAQTGIAPSLLVIAVVALGAKTVELCLTALPELAAAVRLHRAEADA